MSPPTPLPGWETIFSTFVAACWQQDGIDTEGYAATVPVTDDRRGELVRRLRQLRSSVSAELARVTKAFSDEWKEARRVGRVPPALEDWLSRQCRRGDPPAKHLRLFAELLKRELRLLQSQGLLADPQAYRQRFRGLSPEYAAALEESLTRYSREFAGRFTIARLPDGSEDELGAGAQGQVLRGADTLLDRAVAIKRVIDPTSREAADRLRREARTLARLTDADESAAAGVPATYGFGFDAELRLCVAMRLISRKDLTGKELDPRFSALVAAFHSGDRVANRRSTAFLDRLAQLTTVCRVVAAAHAHRFRILHRDLKPNNILVDSAGRAFVCDWGLAVWANADAVLATGSGGSDRDGDMTSHSLGGGTDGYMSPEQASTTPQRIDVTSDVFTLGACLFNLITGRRVYDCVRPWWAAGRTLLRPTTERDSLRARARAYRRTPNPRGVNHTADPELCDIVRKALAPKPEDRYQSAADLALALELWRDDKTQKVPSAAGWVRRQRHRLARATRKHTLAVTVVLVVLALVGLGGWWAWTAMSDKASADRAAAAKAEAARSARESGTAQYHTLKECTALVEEAHIPGLAENRTESLNNRLQALLEAYTNTVAECLRLAPDAPANEQLSRDLADARRRVGRVLHAKGQFAKARAVFAAGVSDTLTSPHDLTRQRAELEFELGDLESGLGSDPNQFLTAIGHYDNAEKEWRKRPNDPDQSAALARVIGCRGDSRVRSGQIEAAEKDYRQSLDRRAEGAKKPSNSPVAFLQLAYGHANLARLEYHCQELYVRSEHKSGRPLSTRELLTRTALAVILQLKVLTVTRPDGPAPAPALHREARIALGTSFLNLGEAFALSERVGWAGGCYRVGEGVLAAVHTSAPLIDTGLLLLRARVGLFEIAIANGTPIEKSRLESEVKELLDGFNKAPKVDERFFLEHRMRFEELARRTPPQK